MKSEDLIFIAVYVATVCQCTCRKIGHKVAESVVKDLQKVIISSLETFIRARVSTSIWWNLKKLARKQKDRGASEPCASWCIMDVVAGLIQFSLQLPHDFSSLSRLYVADVFIWDQHHNLLHKLSFCTLSWWGTRRRRSLYVFSLLHFN